MGSEMCIRERFKITEDGNYEIGLNALRSSGLNGSVTGANLRLYRNGSQVPVEVSNDGAWGENDFLRFRGYKNKAELDTYLYPNGQDDITNPDASLYTDTAVYFLTLETTGSPARVVTVANDQTSLPAVTETIEVTKTLTWMEKIHRVYEYIDVRNTFTALSDSKFFGGKGLTTSRANAQINFDLYNLSETSNRNSDIHYRGVTNIGDFALKLGHDISIALNNETIDTIYSAYSDQLYISRKYTDTNKLIKKGPNTIVFTGSYPADQFFAGMVKITYPATTDIKLAEPVTFRLIQRNTDNYLVFRVSDITPQDPVLSDSLATWQIKGIIEGNEVKFKIPAAYTGGKLIFTPVVNYKNIISGQKLSLIHI